ncbi:MAG TPA: hypothetical protein VHE61_16740 [Opitutaceae bacterium]|nr:hypothetical protein [Opitutaceae bacterium]
MSLLNRLERLFGRFAIPNITLFIIVGQAAVLLGFLMGRVNLAYFVMTAGSVMHGQWWRLFTFVLMPPPPDMFFGYIGVAFAWYMFYLFGSTLEGYWGEFRYNLFLLTGYVLTVAVAFVAPDYTVTNLFLGGSVFLAFARLNPDFPIMLFFILPVRIKWLALATWILYAYSAVTGGTMTRLMIAAAVGNYLLFFARDIWVSIRHGQRTMARRAMAVAEKNEPRHVCYVCGKSDLTNPELDFRYCSKCAGDQCYCPEHIHNHAHVVAPETEPAP